MLYPLCRILIVFSQFLDFTMLQLINWMSPFYVVTCRVSGSYLSTFSQREMVGSFSFRSQPPVLMFQGSFHYCMTLHIEPLPTSCISLYLLAMFSPFSLFFSLLFLLCVPFNHSVHLARGIIFTSCLLNLHTMLYLLLIFLSSFFFCFTHPL